ncbi:MAG TPA: hypothetical protein VMH92_01535 [Acidocella sp.]|nr:hypothetical protein [Acidocella sp.]
MTYGWARLSLLAAGILALRLALYALITGHLRQMPEILCLHDCSWYTSIATTGYNLKPISSGPQTGLANWAFLPLYPLLVHWLAAWGLSAVQAGFILSNTCFLGFMLLAYRYLSLVHDVPNPFLLFGFLAAFPYGLYFSFTYTESLYALLTLACFVSLARRQTIRASLFAALLGATRVTGIVIWPILAIRLLYPAWRQIHQNEWHEASRTLARAPAPLLIAPLGLGLFIAYLALHVGDPLAFIHIQKSWHRTLGNPFFNLFGGLSAIWAAGLGPLLRYDCIFLSACGIIGLALSAWIAKLGRFEEAAFLCMTILLAASTSLVSLQRYVLANPVFLVFLFVFLAKARWRGFFPALILLCAAAQIYLLHLWLQNNPLMI